MTTDESIVIKRLAGKEACEHIAGFLRDDPEGKIYVSAGGTAYNVAIDKEDALWLVSDQQFELLVLPNQSLFVEWKGSAK